MCRPGPEAAEGESLKRERIAGAGKTTGNMNGAKYAACPLHGGRGTIIWSTGNG